MMREKRNLGARRLQTELTRLHQIHLSTATLHKVLSEASVKPIVTYRRKKDGVFQASCHYLINYQAASFSGFR